MTGQALDFAALVRIVRGSRKLMLRWAMIGLIAGLLVALATPPTYRSWATLEVHGPGLSTADAAALLSGPSVAGLHLETVRDSQLLRLGIDADSPQRSAAIANRHAEDFVASLLERRVEASVIARQLVERQVAAARVELERSEQALSAYAQAGRIADAGDASLQQQALAALNKALADATARRIAAEAAYRSGAATRDADIDALRQARAALEGEYQERRALLKPGHPDMIGLRARIDQLGRRIADDLFADYRSALDAEQALGGQVETLKYATLDGRARGIRYRLLQRDLDSNRALYDSLLQRHRQAAAAIVASPISIVERASAPTATYRPGLLFNVLVGLGAGLAIGLGAAIAFDQLHDRIRTPADLRATLGLACLGVIPRPAADAEFLEELNDPLSPVSEAYATLIAHLGDDSGRLLVTSARPCIDKSRSALAIALLLARQGKTVLLADANLRRPAFDRSSQTGLSCLLANEEPLLAHIRASRFARLSLLPAGPAPFGPADLHATGRFGAILEEAKGRFDMVVVDGPPLEFADAFLMARSETAALLVCREGKTRCDEAAEPLRLLRSQRARLLGAVLVGADQRSVRRRAFPLIPIAPGGA